MASGSGLTPRQQERVSAALDTCRRENGLDVSVLVGDLEVASLDQFRGAAERLHAALGADRAPHAVLVVVAPGQRRVEIVTGEAVRRRVPDRVCALAVLSMTSAFAGGDLAGGLVDGLRQIADAAGRAPQLTPGETASHTVPGDLVRRDDLPARHDGPAHHEEPARH